jgi:glycine oxidase
MAIPHIFQSHETAEVVVIGGGVIGLMIARQLVLRGLKDVTLIERGSLGAEASYAAGGILAPQAEADRADDFFRLSCQSRDLYPALASSLLAETGVDIELERSGTLYLAFTDEDEGELEKRYEWQAQAGLEVQKLAAADTRALESCVSENVRAALHFPLDIQVENRRLLTALIKANEESGVRLVTGVGVESVNVEHEQVSGLTTSQGSISTRRVVLAGGAWTSSISIRHAASGGWRSVKIQPVRGQMICFQTKPRLARHVLYSPRGYLVPRLDGRLLAGSTTEHVGFSKEVTVGGVAKILSQAIEIASALRTLPIAESWAGLRPRAEDDLPVLGPSEIAGLFYATGHYRNGILLAPITAQLIAEAILGNVVSPLLNRFAPDRFAMAGAE